MSEPGRRRTPPKSARPARARSDQAVAAAGTLAEPPLTGLPIAPGGVRSELIAGTYRKLRQLIVEGHLGPGARLVEAELAAKFGVSRTPVRTALYLLHQEGYVEARGEGRQSRLTVTPMTQQDAVEIFGLVGEMEGMAARWSAGLDDERRDALVVKLRTFNDAMAAEAAQTPANAAETIRLDNEFHRAYVEAGTGPRLRSFHDSIKPQADRFIYLYYTTLTSEIMESTREHGVIIRAIEEGDAAGAQDAVRNNWANAAVRLSTSIARFGERGVW